VVLVIAVLHLALIFALAITFGWFASFFSWLRRSWKSSPPGCGTPEN